MDWSHVLKEAGPFTAPLCAAMGIAIRWLLSDRKQLIEALGRSQERERQMSEQRTLELRESSAALGESARLVETALERHDRVLEKAMDKWKASATSS
jgi:hypothetical protein